MDSRIRGNFMRSPTRRAKSGKAPRQEFATGKLKRKGRRKRSRINQLGLLALIAFIFFTPDAKQFVLAKWAEIEEYVMEGLAPHQVYPLEAEYTVVRSIDLWNNGSDVGHLEETIPLPVDVSSKESMPVAIAYEDDTEVEKSTIQDVISHEIRVDGQIIQIPLEGKPTKSKDNAIVTNAGTQIWWPGIVNPDNDDFCPHGTCVRVSTDVDSNSHKTLEFVVTIKSTSHSWWHSTRIDGKIEGKSEGVSLARSGTFDEIKQRGGGVETLYKKFGDQKYWYDRSQENWAIDGRQAQAPTVFQTAMNIEASLPNNLKNNAYAYARATFDWLNDNIPYDTNAPNTARSGEQCLDAGIGDCDEQSNAFMSIMRIKEIPSYYVFGALADPQFNSWEGHAWAYVMLPMSDDWCEQNEVKIDTCYIEGAVDVVNRKWLVHTPTVYIDWIEEYSEFIPNGNIVNNYYSGGSMTGEDFTRKRSFHTEGYSVSGGTWNNKWLGEDLT